MRPKLPRLMFAIVGLLCLTLLAPTAVASEQSPLALSPTTQTSAGQALVGQIAEEDVVWGSPSACDTNGNWGLAATVTNGSASQRDYKLEVHDPSTGAFIHGSEAHFIAAGASGIVDLEGIPLGSWTLTITQDGDDYGAPLAVSRLACSPGLIQSTHDHQVMHAVSCLAGNGRVDTNIVNGGRSDAVYRIEFEGLTPRARTVGTDDWWRMPITGRPDRDFDVVVKRDGVTVAESVVTVACDSDPAVVDQPEVRVLNACRDGNGYVLFQFANSEPTPKSWIIEFEGVNNRSTTAAGYGASVRAVTGRPNGIYRALVRSGVTPVAEFSVHVQCDDTIDMPVLSMSFIEPLEGTDLWKQHRAENPVSTNTTVAELRAHIAESEAIALDALNAGSVVDGDQLLDYDLLEHIEFDTYPPYLDGDPYNGRRRPEYDTILDTLLIAHPDFQKPDGEGPYSSFCEYVDAHDVKEVWIWTDHDDLVEPRESMMSSPRDRPRLNLANSEVASDSLPHCEHTYVMYNVNFTRDAESVVHNHLHQIEAVYGRFNGGPIDRELFWFAGGPDDMVNPKGITVNPEAFTFACGDAHWAPNRIRGGFGIGDAEENRYGTIPFESTRDTNCLNWNPNGSAATPLDCSAWECDELSFYTWWLQRMPGPDNELTYMADSGTDHPLRAWHHGIGDFDQIADEVSYTVDLDEVAS